MSKRPTEKVESLTNLLLYYFVKSKVVQGQVVSAPFLPYQIIDGRAKGNRRDTGEETTETKKVEEF